MMNLGVFVGQHYLRPARISLFESRNKARKLVGTLPWKSSLAGMADEIDLESAWSSQLARYLFAL